MADDLISVVFPSRAQDPKPPMKTMIGLAQALELIIRHKTNVVMRNIVHLNKT
jgi:hypothetical protein